MTEEKKETRLTLSGLCEKKRVLEELLNNPGWLAAARAVQEQTDQLQREILLTPCLTVDSTLAQEYKKGQLEGRLCLSDLISTEIEMCISQINHLKGLEEHGNSDDSSDSGSGSDSSNRAP